MSVEDWCPFAVQNRARMSLWGPPLDHEKGVLHTTEAGNGVAFRPSAISYFGHTGYPHFTVDHVAVYQHIPVGRGSRALRRPSGTPDTNYDGAVQIEIMSRAAEIDRLPEATFENTARLMAWIWEATGIPLEAHVEFHPYPPPVRLGQEPWRFTWTQWDGYRGWCGHQHVPGNTHGDPGAIDIDRLLEAAWQHSGEAPDMTDEERARLESAEQNAAKAAAGVEALLLALLPEGVNGWAQPVEKPHGVAEGEPAANVYRYALEAAVRSRRKIPSAEEIAAAVVAEVLEQASSIAEAVNGAGE